MGPACRSTLVALGLRVVIFMHGYGFIFVDEFLLPPCPCQHLVRSFGTPQVNKSTEHLFFHSQLKECALIAALQLARISAKCMHVCTHISINVCMYQVCSSVLHTDLLINIYLSIYLYVCMYVCLCVCVCVCLCVLCVCVYVYICIYV